MWEKSLWTYAENTKFYAFEKDSFGLPIGFLNPELAVNHKYSTYPIQNGAQMRGCSLLIYDGELDRPQNLDMDTCLRYLDTYKTVTGLRQPLFESARLQEERRARTLLVSETQLRRKIDEYLSKTYGPVKRYNKMPGVYETGRATWTVTDKTRGYVVFQRAYNVAATQSEVSVVEYRYDIHGNEHKKVYTVSINEI